jgi:hypothetical protein
MTLPGRVLLGGLAVFLIWNLFRAVRDGVIFSDGVPCNASAQPRRFAEMAALDVIGIVAFSWLAAGDAVIAFWRLLTST